MKIILDILSSLGVGLLGIVFYTLWNSKTYFFNKSLTFSPKTLWVQMRLKMLWVLIMLLITAIVIRVVPDSAAGITSLTGLAIATNIASFFTFGIALMALTKKKKTVT